MLRARLIPFILKALRLKPGPNEGLSDWPASCIYPLRRFAATHGIRRHPERSVFVSASAAKLGDSSPSSVVALGASPASPSVSRTDPSSASPAFAGLVRAILER